MRKTIYALAMLACATAARAEVPAGTDPIIGVFARMLEHEAFSTLSLNGAAAGENDDYFERWVNAAARNDRNSLEAGFTRMLERCDETPAASIVRGEPDPLAIMVAEALRAQRQADGRYAMLSAAWQQP